MHVKSGICKFHYCSNDAKLSFTRERTVKDNSVISSSDSSLKIRINIIKNPWSCTIYKYWQVLKIWDLEILKCSCAFLISNILLLSWYRSKLEKLFEITLWYDCWKMFIENWMSQMSLFISCKYWFIFKIINSRILTKSRWNESLFCFVTRNKS